MSGNAVVSMKSGKQIVSFESSVSADICHEDVTVHLSESSHATGSSHVKTKVIVNYTWENKYYDGHIVACRGDYLAYAIKGKTGGVVRVVSRGTDDRALLKGMVGSVRDLAFAHTANETLLAVVDEAGNLSVFTVDEDMDKKLVVAPYLSLRREADGGPPVATSHRVVWCPYIPDEECEEDGDDTAKLLLLAHGNKADLLNVAILAEEHGPGPHQMADLSEGYVEMLEHSHAITDAAFSPDGTALATASADGYVKFFQIYMQDKEGPRLLHEWQPHKGQPLSALMFLDNHRDLDLNEPFWKYAVTGACDNTELKVWTCETWACLQTVRLQPAPSSGAPNTGAGAPGSLQACIDSSAQFLLLSDIHRRMLYVLSLSAADAPVRFFCSIHEFRLMNPGLSLAVVDARRPLIKPFENVDQLESETAGSDAGGGPVSVCAGDDAEAVEGVAIRCYMVQPRILQECIIVYRTGGQLGTSAEAVGGQNGESIECMSDHLSDVTLNTTIASTGDGAGRPPDSPLAEASSALPPVTTTLDQPPEPLISLMTPEAFTSPNKTGPDLVKSPQSAATASVVSDRPGSPVTSATDYLLNEAASLPSALASSDVNRINSCGSSPSIEVQEILNKSANRQDSPLVEPVASKQQKASFPSPPPPPEETELPTERVAGAPGPPGPPSSSLPPLVIPGVPAASLPSAPPLVIPGAPPAAVSTPGVCGPGGQNGWPTVPPLQAASTTTTPAAQTDDVTETTGTSAGGGDEKRDPSSTALLHSVSGVVDTVRELAAEVQLLRGQLQQQQQQPAAVAPADLRAVMDSALASHQRHIEELLASREREERQRSERHLSGLAQSITSNLKLKLDAAVKQEFKEHVLPLVTSRLKPLESQIRHEMSARIGDVESVAKETASKAVNAKGISEAVAHALTQNLQSTMLSRFREAFSSTAVPAFDKSTREMMHQVNAAFSTGTKEYAQQLEQQLERSRRSREPLLQQMQQSMDAVRLAVDHAATTAKEERDRQHKHRQEEVALLSQVRDEVSASVRRSVAASMEEFQSRISTDLQSRLSTLTVAAPSAPASVLEASPSPRVEIPLLIKCGHYDDAFQKALSASDLDLVVLACESMEPVELFASSPPCPLSQPVLLALVQQLSADLSRDTEIKCRYLEEAVMQIDKEHPAIMEHIHPILLGLQTKLQSFISKPGKHQSLVRSMKMLLMAVRSLAS